MLHSPLMPASSEPAEKIVVRGVNWLGDAIMTMPAVERLRQASPHAQIDLVTPEKIAPLWENSPMVNSVISIPQGSNLSAVAQQLRARRYDVSVVFPNSIRAALESVLGRVPRRIGYRGQWRRWFLTDPITPSRGCAVMRKKTVGEINRLIREPGGIAVSLARTSAGHQMHHYLRLVATLGASPEPLPPRVWLTDVEVAAFADKFELANLNPGRPWLGMNPGAEYGPAKRWPWERFVATALRVHEQTGGRWLIFGGVKDKDIAAQIERALGRTADHAPAAINLAGRTSLRELSAGLKLCSVVLSNDTGPMHLAAAVGTRVVGIFGSTDSGLTAPGLPEGGDHLLLQSRVPCSPCFLTECPIDFRCMSGFGVDQVVAAVLHAAR